MIKRLFYDLETTGVKHWKNGIHQIGAIIEIDGIIVKRLYIHLQPHPDCVVEDEALKVGGINRETLKTYQPMRDGFLAFSQAINKYVDRYNKHDKFHLVGYNNRSFDDQFLRAFYNYNKDQFFGSYFWADSIDVMVMASHKLQDQRHKMLNFKLGTVAKTLSVPFDKEKAHDAMYDIEVTRSIYNIIDLIWKKQ